MKKSRFLTIMHASILLRAPLACRNTPGDSEHDGEHGVEHGGEHN